MGVKHKSIENCYVGEDQGSDYQWWVELKAGWRFTEGRLEGCRWGGFNDQKSFDNASPEPE